jgi:prepilin-type N-terminal cleavage/methylation domain-containing protein/prepilin-type processing-associated H-X9-DG protein
MVHHYWEQDMRASRKAFTLIELLVVVAIIALLISILLPSLKAAREQAKAAVCMSNLKNFGNATRFYLDENQFYFPGGHLQVAQGYIAWPPRLLKYLAQERKIFRCPSTDTLGYWDGEIPRAANLANNHTRALGYEYDERPMFGEPRGGKPEVFSYAYNELGTTAEQFPTGPIFGLGMHAWPGSGDDNEARWAEVHEKRVKSPTNMIVLGDGSATGDGWSQWLTPTPTQRRHNGPGLRHPGETAQMLFVDSHVERLNASRLLVPTDRDANPRADSLAADLRRWNSDFEPHMEDW